MIDEVIRAGTVRYRSIACPECHAPVGQPCPGDVLFPHGLRWLEYRRSRGEVGRIATDPQIQWGDPCIAGTRLPTSCIYDRWLAGDSVAHLAEDYRIDEADVQAAIDYETARAAERE